MNRQTTYKLIVKILMHGVRRRRWGSQVELGGGGAEILGIPHYLPPN